MPLTAGLVLPTDHSDSPTAESVRRTRTPVDRPFGSRTAVAGCVKLIYRNGASSEVPGQVHNEPMGSQRPEDWSTDVEEPATLAFTFLLDRAADTRQQSKLDLRASAFAVASSARLQAEKADRARPASTWRSS